MLALTFANKADYDKVQEDDNIDIENADIVCTRQITSY
jgi:hypothetical protein